MLQTLLLKSRGPPLEVRIISQTGLKVTKLFFPYFSELNQP